MVSVAEGFGNWSVEEVGWAGVVGVVEDAAGSVGGPGDAVMGGDIIWVVVKAEAFKS